MIIGHGGNIHEIAVRYNCRVSDIVDMSSNVNPLGPPPGLIVTLKNQLSGIEMLPEADARGINEAFARRYAISPEKVLAGNGTTQFIYALPKVLESQKVLILGPAYSDYADACKMHDVSYVYEMAKDSDGFFHDLDKVQKLFHQFDTIFICNPNNPTGVFVPGSVLKKICKKYPGTFFVVDESYLPFVSRGESESLVNADEKNLVILNSMSKIFRIPGLRIGFVIADPVVIQKFFRYYLPWSVNSLAQTAIYYLMRQSEEINRFICQSQQYLKKERDSFLEIMNDCKNIQFFESTTSFVLAKLTHGVNSGTVCDLMARQHILIRNCENFAGLSNRFVRVSLKTSDINRMAAEKLLRIMHMAGKDIV